MEELLDQSNAWIQPKTMPACTIEDMSAVELEIAARFKGVGGKCSFLRSASYQRLRLRALYEQHLSGEYAVYHNGLKLTLFEGNLTVEWTKPACEDDAQDDALGKRKRFDEQGRDV